ncbi:DUF336-domain-containing protein [Saitoella complicata NRRL Y-17804]|uniref:DUF336-domain-containing protein n=1 Tax=Saitoella complicata (strain BCRC 22490 / CBS 7301 / JCM 7358 / NBRC 10748 / NRRL Y-17804) TaxID=698492 RepID=UPI00086751B2|nr:DUF336-domain-containing protein [Saitoella complicata NRRL Y-17804]ODQ54896.1 DUF336-domain-containing protein [Saitoella complicata NRRL Y-17804]
MSDLSEYAAQHQNLLNFANASKDELLQIVKDLNTQSLRLRFPSFSFTDAHHLGQELLRTVQTELPESEQNKPVVIDIQLGAMCVYHLAQPGTTPDNDTWISRKRALVNRFHTPSFTYGRQLQLAGKTLADKGLREAEYAAHGGCVPIVLESGVCVGTVTVSGLSQAWDHLVVGYCMEELKLSK